MVDQRNTDCSSVATTNQSFSNSMILFSPVTPRLLREAKSNTIKFASLTHGPVRSRPQFNCHQDDPEWDRIPASACLQGSRHTCIMFRHPVTLLNASNLPRLANLPYIGSFMQASVNSAEQTAASSQISKPAPSSSSSSQNRPLDVDLG
ncbi:hypothetical protein CCHR01_16336 [Colletotrichum chrysophilum]|uniref:Uncharacterized protein n=1 Tax=Colletotrichum chrysophilum TaxID=1836956 RepID=A0AAD9A600_9PEZI|nr:hypothetical protein CCHR01_16336 [Colletotrichum chrysophilum]